MKIARSPLQLKLQPNHNTPCNSVDCKSLEICQFYYYKIYFQKTGILDRDFNVAELSL